MFATSVLLNPWIRGGKGGGWRTVLKMGGNALKVKLFFGQLMNDNVARPSLFRFLLIYFVNKKKNSRRAWDRDWGGEGAQRGVKKIVKETAQKRPNVSNLLNRISVVRQIIFYFFFWQRVRFFWNMCNPTRVVINLERNINRALSTSVIAPVGLSHTHASTPNVWQPSRHGAHSSVVWGTYEVSAREWMSLSKCAPRLWVNQWRRSSIHGGLRPSRVMNREMGCLIRISHLVRYQTRSKDSKTCRWCWW